MKRWPWISMIVAAVVVINPLGQDIIYAAFFSGEQLARNIWQPIAFVAGAILVVLAVIEWWIRKRRAA